MQLRLPPDAHRFHQCHHGADILFPGPTYCCTIANVLLHAACVTPWLRHAATCHRLTAPAMLRIRFAFWITSNDMTTQALRCAHRLAVAGGGTAHPNARQAFVFCHYLPVILYTPCAHIPQFWDSSAAHGVLPCYRGSATPLGLPLQLAVTPPLACLPGLAATPHTPIL